MPQRDRYHEQIKTALMKAGWIITHDPYTINFEGDIAYVDLGAEQVFARPAIQVLIADYRINLIVIDIAKQEVTEWRTA
jgi:hypothetical protein